MGSQISLPDKFGQLRLALQFQEDPEWEVVVSNILDFKVNAERREEFNRNPVEHEKAMIPVNSPHITDRRTIQFHGRERIFQFYECPDASKTQYAKWVRKNLR